MIDLKQKQLKEWQEKNFGIHEDDILKCALGMSEEVGEVCHHVLKGVQKIRFGIGGIDKKQVADGIADTLIFGLQILSKLDLDAEKEIAEVIEKVLQRDWIKDPSGKKMDKPVQHAPEEPLYKCTIRDNRFKLVFPDYKKSEKRIGEIMSIFQIGHPVIIPEISNSEQCVITYTDTLIKGNRIEIVFFGKVVDVMHISV